MQSNEKEAKKEMKEYKKLVKRKKENVEIAQIYASYLFNKITMAENLDELKMQTITMEEFIHKIQN